MASARRCAVAKIYYVGDWAVMTGPVFAETPFYHAPKGLDIFSYGKWLKDALESSGKHTVESVPTWDKDAEFWLQSLNYILGKN
jgi:hypothetical protein